jgi:hypothetical protein
MFESVPIDLPCPVCGHAHRKPLEWFHNRESMVCEGCGVLIALDQRESRRALKQLEETWRSVVQTIGKK